MENKGLSNVVKFVPCPEPKKVQDKESKEEDKVEETPSEAKE